MISEDLFQAAEATLALLDEAKEAKTSLTFEEYGIVRNVQEGIVFASGLPKLQSRELVQFQNGGYGLAFNLSVDQIGIVLLDQPELIRAGQQVKRTGGVLNVPVGFPLLGRILDPLGRPLDKKKPLQTGETRPIEKPAPRILDRLPVTVPLMTGILSIDAMIPIGRGQRELILGDRQTGKTAIALDTIINQKNKEVLCIYCSIGKEASEIQRVYEDLKAAGALDYSLIVAATGKDTAGLNTIAPYSAMAMGEYFMEQGKDVLIVFDDLTRHAWSYRELSLLLRRPPTREAYPGDIFYLHSRLLERATHLKEEYGGGSITALPIIETEEENISAYIPTNLISITDGQIYLSPRLFQEGILPATDVGKSVSRVGGKTQFPIYQRVVKDLKLTYAQFEELESFSRFGARLDTGSQKSFERGKQIRETLKQNRLDPLPVATQIAIFLALSEGAFHSMPLEQIPEEKKQIAERIEKECPELFRKLNETGQLSEEEFTQFKEVAIHASSAPNP